MPGDGRLAPMPPGPPGRGGMPAGRCGAPVPGPTGRGTPGTAPGASGRRGAVDACEVKGLLPIRGGPEVARGTAGPGRGPADGGRDAPESPGRRVVGSATAGAAAWAAGATGARKTSVVGLTRSTAGAAGAGGATGAAATGATTSAARGLSAVRAVAAAFGAAGGAATTAGTGKDSLSLRTTGASIVEEAERTNSPNS
jgi:hypothetical protein